MKRVRAGKGVNLCYELQRGVMSYISDEEDSYFPACLC